MSDLRGVEFQGKGEVISEEGQSTIAPVWFKLELAPNADAQLVDQAARAISMLVMTREAEISAIIEPNN